MVRRWLEDKMGEAVAGGLRQARPQLKDQVVPHLHADKPGGTTGE